MVVGDTWVFDADNHTPEQLAQAYALLGAPLVDAMLEAAVRASGRVVQQFVITSSAAPVKFEGKL